MKDSSISKKKILHLLDSGGMYGAENVIINLSREMMANGLFEPIVGCIVQKESIKVDLELIAYKYGIKSYKIVVNNFLLFRDLPRFASLLKKKRIDLIHAHGYKATVFAYVLKLCTSIHVISTCHLWFEGSCRPLKMRLMIALEKFAYRFFPVIVSVSEDIRNILIKAGVPRNKIRVVQNGIVVSDYTKMDLWRRDKLKFDIGLQNGDICILNVGRLTEQKAQSVLINAAKLVKEYSKKIKFFIAGDGELGDKLVEQINSLELNDTVKLLGFRDDIPDLLKVADLFVLPSLDEGMPMALLEAVASQIPVITTQVGDIPKLIIPNVSGVVVEINDVDGLAKEILNLVEDKGRQTRLIEKASMRVNKLYSSQVMYEQYQEVYKGIFKWNHI